ncbi:MAG: MMPL family transporter [Candidatus Nanohaloarchaea archaeon]|nr:MMPL family transporter [Candidatus Nanohaloarchaea archaeon]
MKDRLLEIYADFVVEQPLIVLTIALAVILGLGTGALQVKTVEQGMEDFLPESFDSIAAFNTVQDEFETAGGTTYRILFLTDPSHANSTEVRDVRNPRFLRYLATVNSDITRMDSVEVVRGPTNLFQELPVTEQETKRILDRLGKERWSSYIAPDYTAARMEVIATGLSPAEQIALAEDIRASVEMLDPPPGIEVYYTGQTYIDEAFQQETQRTMRVTSLVAILGVILVLLGIFRSVFYSATALSTLVLGIVAGFGAYGHLGLNMAPATSGAVSMGVGIAVDFGIQPVARYREERRSLGIEEALETTISGIFRPMTLGMLAALVGFASLSFGRIAFLSDMGTMLTLTTFFAYMSAFTVIPSFLIIHDRYIDPIIDVARRYSIPAR